MRLGERVRRVPLLILIIPYLLARKKKKQASAHLWTFSEWRKWTGRKCLSTTRENSHTSVVLNNDWLPENTGPRSDICEIAKSWSFEKTIRWFTQLLNYKSISDTLYIMFMKIIYVRYYVYEYTYMYKHVYIYIYTYTFIYVTTSMVCIYVYRYISHPQWRWHLHGTRVKRTEAFASFGPSGTTTSKHTRRLYVWWIWMLQRLVPN